MSTRIGKVGNLRGEERRERFLSKKKTPKGDGGGGFRGRRRVEGGEKGEQVRVQRFKRDRRDLYLNKDIRGATKMVMGLRRQVGVYGTLRLEEIWSFLLGAWVGVAG